ncbi:MAG: HAMP domain-containing histidine kinase [Chitinophagaceae bacterium]|nr:MAG: HAMP domain-containing histidine kinase [Chitinophagaceae bacterium]
MKIQTQTAILFTALAAAVILLLNAVIYYVATRDTSNDFKKRLELRVIVASKIHFENDTTSSVAYSELSEQYLEELPSEKEYFVKVNGANDSLSIPPELHLPSSFFDQLRTAKTTVYYNRNGVHYAGILHQSGKDTYMVIKSAVNMYGLQALKNLRQILFFAFLGKVVLVFTVSFFFSRKAFKPFRDIIARVKSIGVENLSLRLREKRGKDEISELSKTFNRMLDRLQTSFDIQNNFVSNASHELKTPLTAIIGEADIVLSKQRSPEEYRQALEVILKEAEKLEALTTALLSLAQSGFNKNKLNEVPVRMDELLFDIKETINRIDPENRIKLLLQDMPLDEDRLMVQGNPQLLKLAISNIILNACKYSNNQEVTVKLTCPGDQALIDITDIGIGIPHDDIQHVFVPFFRASNTGSFKGYGVGLPLSMNIIRQHSGNIKVDSEEGKGTVVTVWLPLKKAV